MLLHEFVSHVHAEKTKNPHSPVIGYFPLLERNLQGYFQRVNTLDSKDKVRFSHSSSLNNVDKNYIDHGDESLFEVEKV